jgi:long-chain acyl-CoA synthetase
MEAKLKNIKNSCVYDHALFDKLIFKKLKDLIFGGEIRLMISGSAPISKEILNFF